MITQVPKQNETRRNSSELYKQLISSKYRNKVQSLNETLLSILCHEIQNEKILIPQKQKPFKLNAKQDQNSQFQAQMSGLMQKKLQIQNQLKKIELQEYRFHVNQSKCSLNQSKLSQTLHNNSSADRMFRSQLTEQQKLKIRSVIKCQKKFIKQLKQKEKQHYEQLEEDRKKNIEIQQNIKREKYQERKQYWQKIRQDVSKRQDQRKIKFVQDQNRLKDVKNSKKLYEILQKSWNNKVNADQNKIKQATEHMRQDHKFVLAKITEHQRQYEKLSKQQEQKRLRNFEEFKEKIKVSLPKLHHSKFFETLKEEQKMKEQKQVERQKRKFQLSQRKSQFSSKVKQNFKPKVDQNLKNILLMTTQQQKVQKNPGLPFNEVINLGNDYMRQAHRTVALVKQGKGSRSKLSEIEQVKRPSYKNYLSELKDKRKAEQIKQKLTNEVVRIMKNTSYSTVQRIQRAKLVAKRLQSKQNKQSSALIKSINQKMKILKVLSNQ